MAPRLAPSTDAPEAIESFVAEPGSPRSHDHSDVFVCRRVDAEEETDTSVTLFVYGWHNVEPGPLSWVFPSLRAALDAVKTMRNAVRWSIVAGRDHATIEEARAHGTVLVEQLDRSF